jgi:LruC domain-containing protein
MIPYDFRWPLERICINKAYLQFNSWGSGSIEDNDWYKYPEEDLIF